MGLKIAFILIIATPLTGVIIAFIIPMFSGISSAHMDRFEDGLELHNQGQLESAIDEYSKAIELKPDFARALVKRGEAWFALDDHAQALWDYNEAIAYEKQMMLKVVTRDFQEYKAAMAQAHFGRALIYEAQGYSLKATSEAARAEELGLDPIVIDAGIPRP